MELGYSPTAFRQLAQLEKEIQQRILRKLDFYLSQEQPLKFADRLTNAKVGQWRYRIGEYRVIFDVHADTLFVLAIGHRKDIYR